jgi:hypothetical protein
VIRDAVERRLRERRLVDGALLPDYGGYCFARVPGTIESVLDVEVGAGAESDPGGEGPRPLPATGESRGLPLDVLTGVGTDVDAVVCVLVDGFGLEQWRRFESLTPSLGRLTERARVTPLTSVYPSETAAAITTLSTGRTPAEHGLLGWNVFDADRDLVYESLPFRTKAGAPAAEAGVSPAELFAGEASTTRLSRAGVDARVLVPAALTASPHGTRAYADASVHGYDDLDDLAETLAGLVTGTAAAGVEPTTSDGRTFVHAYLPHVDATSHRHGTTADAYATTVASVFDAVGRGLGVGRNGSGGGAGGLDGPEGHARGLDPERTLVVVTADHGHVDTDPDGGIDLTSIPAVAESVRRTEAGRPAIAGGPRNVHLYLDHGTVGRVRAALSDLPAALRTYTRAEALANGLFGPGPHASRLADRVGDLIVIPGDESVWYDAPGEDELDLVGMHGGLDPDEMLVPFAVARLSTLR